MKRITSLWGLMLVFILVSGCATQRVNQFKTFAEAGRAYSDAMVSLTQEAAESAIDTNSDELLKRRSELLERMQEEEAELKAETHPDELEEKLDSIRKRYEDQLGEEYNRSTKTLEK